MLFSCSIWDFLYDTAGLIVITQAEESCAPQPIHRSGLRYSPSSDRRQTPGTAAIAAIKMLEEGWKGKPI
jgi:hypothetical protein